MVAAPELPLALSITFAKETSTISLTLFNQPEPTARAIPLELKFKYDPSTPYAPIHEIVDDRNARIKEVRLASFLLPTPEELELDPPSPSAPTHPILTECLSFAFTRTALLGSLVSRSSSYQRNVSTQDHR